MFQIKGWMIELAGELAIEDCRTNERCVQKNDERQQIYLQALGGRIAPQIDAFPFCFNLNSLGIDTVRAVDVSITHLATVAGRYQIRRQVTAIALECRQRLGGRLGGEHHPME